MKARGRLPAASARFTMSTSEVLLIMALALGAGGFLKGATGAGLPLIALPVLAAFLGVAHAVAIISLPVLVTNVWQTVQLRGELRELRFLPPMLIAGAVGVIAGVWALTVVPDRGLSTVLAVLLLAYIALRLTRPDFRIREAASVAMAWPAGFVSGILQGATGISAPVALTFIHALRLPREAYVAAVSTMFLVLVTLQIPAMAVAGILDGERIIQSALAILPAVAAMPVGAFFASRLTQTAFDRVILTVLGVIALELLAKGAGL